MSAGRDRPGFNFYTTFRGKGSPEAVIREFSAAARDLIDRQVDDLQGDRYGEYGGRTRLVMHTLADVTQGIRGHVDVFEAHALAPTGEPEVDDIARTVVANVLQDSGFSQLARARIETPPAEESKFDQGLGGKIIEEMPDIAEKIEVLFEGIAKIFFLEASEPLDGAGKLIGAVLRDIGLVGKLGYGISGGDEVGEQLEKKLEAVIPGINRLSGGQAVIREIIDRTEGKVDRIDQEVGHIEAKADELGELLGVSIVGEPWIVDPTVTRTGPNKVPRKSLKEEIHWIECLLDQFYEIMVGEPYRKPPGPSPFGPTRVGSPDPVSPGGPTIVETPGSPGGGESPPSDSPHPQPQLLGPLIKKIFVWEEDVFELASATEERVVLVETPAFDLAGWLDLTQLRAGDRVQTELLVSMAGQPYRSFAVADFTQPAVLPFSALAAGENKVSGTDVQVVIRQPASADGFATGVPIAYQFIVESQ